MNKLNLYVFIEIFKSCTLVFFIFISISWLLQISRLFNLLSNLQIEIYSLIKLSFFIVPNLINVTLPFIILFGLVIAFLKFDRDRELIAMYSSGLSINQIIKPLVFIIIFFTFINILLNLFISPLIYEKYKFKEYELRNTLDLNNINIVNFIKLDEKLILDFDNQEGLFKDVFIRHLGINENIIYAKNAKIKKNNKEIIFNLNSGFKLSFNDNEIEKLEFKTYQLSLPIKQSGEYINFDKNTQTIAKLLKNKNYKIIFEKILDTLIIITIILFFYINNIRQNNFKLNSIFIYLTLSLFLIIINSIIKNIEIKTNIYFVLSFINILFIYVYIFFKKVNLR